MLEIVIILAIYTVVVLLFVPLERIGKWQTDLKKWVKRLTDRMEK